MKKILMCSFILFLLLNSCRTVKYYDKDGNIVGKKSYKDIERLKLKTVLANLSPEDKKILDNDKLTKIVKDSLIRSYYDH